MKTMLPKLYMSASLFVLRILFIFYLYYLSSTRPRVKVLLHLVLTKSNKTSTILVLSTYRVELMGYLLSPNKNHIYKVI